MTVLVNTLAFLGAMCLLVSLAVVLVVLLGLVTEWRNRRRDRARRAARAGWIGGPPW